jgi:hypothetical protein
MIQGQILVPKNKVFLFKREHVAISSFFATVLKRPFPRVICAEPIKVSGCPFLNSLRSNALATVIGTPVLHTKKPRGQSDNSINSTLYPGGKRLER